MKTFRISKTEHRTHQYDVQLETEAEVLEKFPEIESGARGYFVRVEDDHGMIRVEELCPES